MDSRAALGAAAAVALTITGGVSALFLTVAQAAPSTPDPAQSAATVEYVDQFGNPVPAPGTATPVAAAPEVILVNPDGTSLQPQADPPPAYADAEGEYDEHEEDEYEEDEEHEEDGEHD